MSRLHPRNSCGEAFEVSSWEESLDSLQGKISRYEIIAVWGMKLVAMAAARSVVAGLVARVMLQCVGAAVKTSETQVLSSIAWSTRAAQLRQSHLVQGRCKWAVQSRTLLGGRPVVYANYTTMEVGTPGSLEYRVFYSDESGRPVSSRVATLVPVPVIEVRL